MNGARIRIIENPTRRMQRLGFLKHVVSRASQTATSSLSVIGDDLLRTVSKKVLISATPELFECVRVTSKEQVDKSLLGKVKEALEQTDAKRQLNVELQDIYLSSRDLPSQRGRLVSSDRRHYPRFAVGLGLLRKDSFALLVRGQVLLKLVSSDELNAFTEYSESTNPLMLTLGQKIFYLFTFIESDKHLLLPFYRDLLLQNGDFADWQAGDLLPGIVRELCYRFRTSVRTGADALRVRRLLETANAIERWRGKPYSGKGARDETATVRLEPFVDLGILCKDNPFSYRYRFTPGGRIFMNELTKHADPDDYLDQHFFSKLTDAFGLSISPFREENDIARVIYDSFLILASPLGYAPIREVMLLAAIRAVEGGNGYFEMAMGLETLQHMQQQHPEAVRFNVNRWGNVTLVKFTKKPSLA